MPDSIIQDYQISVNALGSTNKRIIASQPQNIYNPSSLFLNSV